MTSFQIETEKPNAVAFSIPVEVAPSGKALAVKERIEKRLTGETSNEACDLESVNEKLSKAKELREGQIEKQAKVLQERSTKRE